MMGDEINQGDMDGDNILRILVKMGEKKKDLRIQGLGDIHPMYEALTALMRSHLSDQTIVRRYARDEQSLRAILAVDVFLDYVSPDRKSELIILLNSGEKLEKIVHLAASEISGDKSANFKQDLTSRANDYGEGILFRRGIAISAGVISGLLGFLAAYLAYRI